MAWLGLGESASKNSPQYWKPALANAQKELWKRNTDGAGKLYVKINIELKTVKPKNLQDEILITKAEARLGLWAANYLTNTQEPAGYRKILNAVKVTPRLWLFVAKVFGLNGEISIEALFAYQELLKCKPTEKNAQAVLGILRQAEFSITTTNLLEIAARILPDDIVTASWFCRWALKANYLDKSDEFAKEILKRSPNNAEANRCLGFSAERHKLWATARNHYKKSQDGIRLAVCCNHLEDYPAAIQALNSVENEKQVNPTWLYHAGWAYYKTGALLTAFEHWRALEATGHLNRDHQLLDTINKRLFNQYLVDTDELDTPLPETMPEEDKAEVHMRRGAIQLLLRRDPEKAEENFRKVAFKLPKSPLPGIYLMASRISPKEDPALDKTAFEQLKRLFGDASIYLLLRGLWLAQSNPGLAIRYLQKASQEGLSRHVPAQAITAMQWLLINPTEKVKALPIDMFELLVSKPNSQQPGQENASFFIAIRTSLGYYKIINEPEGIMSWIGETPEYNFINTTSWKKFQAVYFAIHKKWEAAIDALNTEAAPSLEEKLISQGIYQSATKKEWQITASIVAHALKKKETRNAFYEKLALFLQGALLQKLWLDHDYPAVENQLQELMISQPGNSHVHHNLAILYTRWALSQQDSPITTSHLNLLERLIGHWAVVFSDNRYWTTWKEQTNQFYEDKLDQPVMDNLIDEDLPGLLRAYFRERENQISAAQTDKHYDYSILLEYEIDTLIVVRRLVAKAGTGNLPIEVSRWLSPILVKAYAKKDVGKQVIATLTQYQLTNSETRQIRLAFSELNEIHVLALSDHHETALNKLYSLEQKQGLSLEYRTDITDERIFILECYSKNLMKHDLWDEALKQASALHQIGPRTDNVEKLYIDASLGWAKQRIDKEDYAAAVNHLREIKKSIRKQSIELNASLAEALTLWGKDAFESEQVSTAQKRFEEALGLDSANMSARDGMARVYNAKAIDASEKNDLKTAAEYSQKMYEFLQTLETATLYARSRARYALKLSADGMFQAAIQVLNLAVELPYDHSEFQIEILMSGILTDQGAQLMNSGQFTAGIEVTRRAIQFDPDNDVARNNLALARRRY